MLGYDGEGGIGFDATIWGRRVVRVTIVEGVWDSK